MTKNLELQGAMDCLVAVGRLQSSIDRPLDDAISRGLDIVPGMYIDIYYLVITTIGSS